MRSTETLPRSSEAGAAPAAPPNGKPVQLHRRVRLRHGLLAGLLLAAGSAVLYGFWPALTGGGEEGGPASETGAPEAVAPIEAVVVQPADFPLRAEATGHLAPWRAAEISAEAGGLVTERLVEEGEAVGEGAGLLRLDDRQARIDLAEAESERLKARAEHAVNTRSGDVAEADTSVLAQRRATLERARDAYARGVISREELREAERRFEAADVLSGRQRGAVGAAVYGLSQAEQRVEMARLALDHTRVQAPFAGRVADLEVEEGQRMSAGQALLTLLDDAQMKVDVDVLEGDLVRLRPGSSALVRVPALGDEIFRGRVHTINPEVDWESGTGRVTVALPNPGRRLVAGLFAYVELETERLPDRLVVPAEAVLVRQGRDLVFVAEGGRAAWTYVTVGARSGDHVEIAEGLAPGDTVAVAGHFALAHDAPVEVTGIAPAFEP